MAKLKTIPGIPRTEILWLTYERKDGTVFYITSKVIRDYYFCYKLVNGKAEKLGKAKSPLDLEEKYFSMGIDKQKQ